MTNDLTLLLPDVPTLSAPRERRSLLAERIQLGENRRSFGRDVVARDATLSMACRPNSPVRSAGEGVTLLDSGRAASTPHDVLKDETGKRGR
jgi:hypothetical protein